MNHQVVQICTALVLLFLPPSSLVLAPLVTATVDAPLLGNVLALFQARQRTLSLVIHHPGKKRCPPPDIYFNPMFREGGKGGGGGGGGEGGGGEGGGGRGGEKGGRQRPSAAINESIKSFVSVA